MAKQLIICELHVGCSDHDPSHTIETVMMKYSVGSSDDVSLISHKTVNMTLAPRDLAALQAIYNTLANQVRTLEGIPL